MTYTAIPLPCPYATLWGVYGTGHDAIAILPPVDAVLLRDRLNEEERHAGGQNTGHTDRTMERGTPMDAIGGTTHD